jgi:hypothetical protein
MLISFVSKYDMVRNGTSVQSYKIRLPTRVSYQSNGV